MSLILGVIILIVGGYAIGRLCTFSFAYEYMFTGNHTQRMWALRKASRAHILATGFAMLGAYFAYGVAQAWPFLIAFAVCNISTMAAILQGK